MLVRYPRPWLGVLTAAVVATATRFPSQQGFVFAPCRAQAPRERQPLPRDHRHVMMPLSCGSPSSSSSSSSSSVVSVSTARAEGWRKAVLPFLPPERCRSASPAESLRRGEWFKLICGASFEDLPAVRDLALVYTLAGADCIDVAAEEAVIEAARDGVLAAVGVAEAIGKPMLDAPWLMMSVNDDEEDPHFRKAAFDPTLCPTDCPRPCETVCPADAVVFPDSAPPPAQRAAMVDELFGASAGGGVLGPRCYGCGRCIAVCPPGIIRAEKYKRSPSVVRELLEKVDGVEIHTKGDLARFRDLWEGCIASAASRSGFKVVAVSFPDLGEDTGLAVATMGALMDNSSGAGIEEGEGEGRASEGAAEVENSRGGEGRGRAAAAGRALNVWQTDGRPMSGDTGRGATVASVRLAEKVLETRALPFGEGQHFVQLAGGTNDRTAEKLREVGLIGGDGGPGRLLVEGKGDHGGDEQQQQKRVGGVAYGGYARKVVGRALDRLPSDGAGHVEDYPDVLSAALKEASLLVGGLKRPL